MTDDEVAGMGATDVGGAAPAAPLPRAVAGKPKVTREVPIVLGEADKQRAIETVDRLNQIKNGLGVDVDEEGQILLDHDKSRAITHGYDPEAHTLNMRRYGLETRKGDVAKTSERSGIGQLFFGDKEYDPYKDLKGGFFEGPKTKALNEAQREWALISQLVGHREEGKVGADPSTYLFSRDQGESTKRETRERLAQKIRQEARTLPVGVGDKAREQFNRIADYIEKMEPSMLHGAHKTMQDIADLADKHASPPVKAAVDAAIKEQADPERTSMFDAFKVGFGDNVAPMTMGLGSLLTQGNGGEVRAPGADVITRDPKTGLETTTRAAPAGPGGQTGRDVETMHQRIVENMTGKSPQEQAALIEQLKEEHPRVYTIGSILGWFSDPVGLVGGLAVKGAAKAGEAIAGTAGKFLGAAAAGAPQGIVSDLAAGGEGGAVPALVGAAGGAAGELVNAAAGKATGTLAGAPERMQMGEMVAEGRRAAHEIMQEAHRHGVQPKGTLWQEVYRRLEEKFPGMKRGAPRRGPGGKFGPGFVPELAHAADEATVTAHGASPGAGANAHPFMTLMNPNASAGQVGIALGHEAVEGRAGRALTAAALGRGKAITGAIDKNTAALVAAIRSADPHGFRFALRTAREAGVPHVMIQAAEEAYHKRNRERVEADAP